MAWFGDLLKDAGKNIVETFTGRAMRPEAKQVQTVQAGVKPEAKVKSTDELYKGARSTAAKQANDAAGMAKSQAKASTMMGGGSKLAAALAGAGAANQASTNTYNQSTDRYSSMGQQQNQSAINQDLANVNAMNQMNTTNANRQFDAEKYRADNKRNTANNVVSFLGSVFGSKMGKGSKGDD